ncbi:MAG: AAA family ATPase [Opitutales bacterium]|nr:AAA family ATPase [Opitutales bacterium]
MHVENLNLTNFRGARSLPLKLDNRLNVLVGMNGAGKSSLLDSSAFLLSWFANRIKHTGASGRPITESDITNGEDTSTIEMVLIENGNPIQWSITKVRAGHAKKEAGSSLNQLSEAAKRIQLAITDDKDGINLPLFAYYPVNRAVLDIPLRIRERHRFDQLAAYDESLTSGANFRTFFEWFREREDLENEARRDREQLPLIDTGTKYPDPQLVAVRNALEIFMPDFKNLTVRRNPLRMEVEKNGVRLTVNQLSDGEKCLMAMVGDLARRMAIANPGMDNPLKGKGVILIDEIDLHLHPKWQRMIISKLLEVFEGSQFIVSTHSPHVITHVQPENLFLLSLTDKGLQAIQPSESYGKTVERVLEDLMGLETTRPRDVQESLWSIFQQIEKGNLSGARDAIRNLAARIGDDPELVKANVLIKRKELIGR